MLNFEEFKKQIMEDLKFALPERLGELTMEPVNIKKLQNASYDGMVLTQTVNSLLLLMSLRAVLSKSRMIWTTILIPSHSRPIPETVPMHWLRKIQMNRTEVRSH